MAPTYTLTYFTVKGLGEAIRFLLSYGEVNWEDVRIDYATQWPAFKAKTPLGQLPMLEVGGKTVAQTIPICRYLGNIFGINGKDHWEALEIDIAVDTIGDFRTQIQSYHYDPNAASKEAKKKNVFDVTIPFYLPKFEEMLKKNGGYFVGGKLSWADVLWTAQAGYMMTMLKEDITKDYPHLKALEEKVLAIPSIKAWVAKRPESE